MAGPPEPVLRAAPYPVTVSALARVFGLSRSTLLYYDRIGLVSPSARSAAGYRLYSLADAHRLAQLVELRATGLSLEAVREALDPASSVQDLLRQQLAQLNAQANALRSQQQVLERMLHSAGSDPAAEPTKNTARLDRQTWTAMFRAIGMSDEDMRRWHAEFERSRPRAHRTFLASLGIAPADIARIRRWARG